MIDRCKGQFLAMRFFKFLKHAEMYVFWAPQMYSEDCQTLKIECFAKIGNS